MNKTVCLIDDDPLFRLIVERMMRKTDSDLNFVQCENGKAGIEKIKDLLVPDSDFIVLLDLNMPILDGWGFLDQMQSHLKNREDNISIYILSSSKDKSDMEKSKSYSMVRKFYHKPLSNNDIIEILDLGKKNM